jgi:autotransporter-associated beta strand protein
VAINAQTNSKELRMKKLTPVVVSCGLTLLLSTIAKAGSATWDLNPGSGDWNTAVNWTPMTVPNGSADAATFDVSNTTNVSISANTEVNGIAFAAAAPVYTITASPSSTLTVSGIGITNNSATAQHFLTNTDEAGNFGQIFFSNTAVADGAFSNSAAIVGNPTGGSTQFFNSSSAGSASFSNHAGADPAGGGSGGSTQFFNSSTAGNGSFVNAGGDGSLSDQNLPLGGGFTFFKDDSNAGTGTFLNDGATESHPNASPGVTSFFDHSSAANGMFSNHAGYFPDAEAGLTRFLDSSTAGNATFVNNSGPFFTAAGQGGATLFLNASTAGNGTFINNGAPDGEGGFTQFGDNSSAGNGIFTNNPGGLDGTNGSTRFGGNSTAGNATVINNGADSTLGNPQGGSTEFRENSTAGSATLIANGGTNGGSGGVIDFSGDSTGGTSRVAIFGNGNLDISRHNAPGVAIGSIEGDGVIFLGARNLSVGSNNTSTSFSGVIKDGGIAGGISGSLSKIGTGTLELTGANTYTGGTTVSGGTLLVNNTSGSGTGSSAVQVTAGILGGNGTIAGAVTVGAGSGGGALISPGTSPGSLTIQSALTLNSDATYRFELNSTTAVADKIIANGVTLNGAAFLFTDLGVGRLGLGTTFVIIDNTSNSPIGGDFSNLADNSEFSNNGNTYEVSYEGGSGNDLTLTVVPEPSACVMLGLGLAMVGALMRFQPTRGRKRSAPPFGRRKDDLH